jgi:predicted RNase H-like HicB family nuclease
MRKQSKKLVGNIHKAAVNDRPFDPVILDRAREIARKYTILLEPDDDCGYVGTSLEMPGVYNDGKSADDCVKAVRESLTIAVAYLIEKRKTPPIPADEQVRNKQVNIRVTEAEQRRLKEAALARGYTDVSDYLRTSALYAS